MKSKNETEQEERIYSESEVVEMMRAYGHYRELIGDSRGENFVKFCFRDAYQKIISEYETKVPVELKVNLNETLEDRARSLNGLPPREKRELK